MSDKVKLRCPNLMCRAILSVPGDLRGQTVRCSNCGESLRVPAPKPVPLGPRPGAGDRPE